MRKLYVYRRDYLEKKLTTQHYPVFHVVEISFFFVLQYGGNPVSCAIANAVLDVIEKENLRENASQVGDYLLKACETLQKKHKNIGDVRGVGLFVGIELVMDRESRTPASTLAKQVVFT